MKQIHQEETYTPGRNGYTKKLLLLIGALSPVNHRGLHQGCHKEETSTPRGQIYAEMKQIHPEETDTPRRNGYTKKK